MEIKKNTDGTFTAGDFTGTLEEAIAKVQELAAQIEKMKEELNQAQVVEDAIRNYVEPQIGNDVSAG